MKLSALKVLCNLLFACGPYALVALACVVEKWVAVGRSADRFGSCWFAAAEEHRKRVFVTWFSTSFLVPR